MTKEDLTEEMIPILSELYALIKQFSGNGNRISIFFDADHWSATQLTEQALMAGGHKLPNDEFYHFSFWYVPSTGKVHRNDE